MRVIAKRILRDFWERQADSEQQLEAWYNVAEQANWPSPNGIKKDYLSASLLEEKRSM